MREQIARFSAEAEAGEIYEIIEYQNYTEFRPMSGSPKLVPGSKEYFLSDGRSVNFVDAETFEIVDTGEIIRKIG